MADKKGLVLADKGRAAGDRVRQILWGQARRLRFRGTSGPTAANEASGLGGAGGGSAGRPLIRLTKGAPAGGVGDFAGVWQAAERRSQAALAQSPAARLAGEPSSDNADCGRGCG